MDKGPVVPEWVNSNYYKNKQINQNVEIIKTQSKISNIKLYKKSIIKSLALLSGVFVLTATPLGSKIVDTIVEWDNKNFAQEIEENREEVIRNTGRTPEEIMDDYIDDGSKSYHNR